MRARPGSIAPILVLLAACGSEPAVEPGPDASPTASEVGEVPAYAQREGDPEAGYRAMLDEGYVGCGVPYSAYARAFGPAPASLRLPGRDQRNSELPYDLTRFTTTTGVEVVSPNCLTCHAGAIDGELVIGLGNAESDYTIDIAAQGVLAGAFVSDPVEREEWQRWLDRVIAIAPYTVTRTIGVNPADNIAAALFAHRDPETLAWSYQPLMELPPEIVVPVDVPPWWRMKKKHAMFYSAAGRGDHARIMMTASTLCTDSVAEAEAIDAYFPDVRAFIEGLEAPAWPWPVDAELAAAGEVLFEDACASCHGSYGAGASYPNLVVALAEIGTDETLALGAAQFATQYVEWFNRSFYGGIAFLAPAPGYLAPPLDGIWATAPFLHNGSVPTLAALLDSSTRPKYWTRSFDSRDYDPAALGWQYTELAGGQDDEPDEDKRKLIYDTTQLGYGNRGHRFADFMTGPERAALLEYLKTL